MSTSTQVRVLSDYSIAITVAAGGSAEAHNGFRTISLNSFASYDSDGTIEIPDELNSEATLEFCGFQTAVAKQIFDAFAAQNEQLEPEDIHGDVSDWARTYIQRQASHQDAWLSTQDWNAALQHQGISSATRARILSPEFDSLRLSASASEWALDTVLISWDFLRGLDNRVKEKKIEVDKAESPDPTVRSSGLIQPPSLKDIIQQGNFPESTIEVDVPTEVAGKKLFYKEGSWSRLSSVFNTDGTINLSPLLGASPTDFHPNNRLVYLSNHQKVAERYARYVTERVPPEEGAILYIAVPNDMIESPREVLNPDWADLVWSSRNSTVLVSNFGVLPAHLRQYELATVLVGDICNQSNRQVNRLRDRSELHTIRLNNGERGSQTVFQTPTMLQELATRCRGSVWISSTRNPKKARTIPQREDESLA